MIYFDLIYSELCVVIFKQIFVHSNTVYNTGMMYIKNVGYRL